MAKNPGHVPKGIGRLRAGGAAPFQGKMTEKGFQGRDLVSRAAGALKEIHLKTRQPAVFAFLPTDTWTDKRVKTLARLTVTQTQNKVESVVSRVDRVVCGLLANAT